MKKKILLIFLIVIFLGTLFYLMVSSEIIKLETASSMVEDDSKVVLTVEDLEDGKFYIWHDSIYGIEHDLEGAVDKDVFKLCPSGTINWKKNKYVNRTIWFSSTEDVDIPTLFPGDKLIYVSKTNTPGSDGSALDYGNINWERYADYGYTIGVSNLTADKSGHYFIDYDPDNGYEGYINKESDLKDVGSFKSFKGYRIYLDKVGSKDVRYGLMSPGGTILGLDKDQNYLCKWYKGTYVSDFSLVANQRTFGSLESFITYDWNFISTEDSLSDIHSCIAITIPSYFKSGYYYIADTGLFRYVAMEDISKYNGSVYDPNLNWNDPIILYDEFGMVLYNPFENIDNRDKYDSVSGNNPTIVIDYDKQIYNSDFEVITDPSINESDSGAEEYEELEVDYYYESDDDAELEGSTRLQ